MCRSDVPQCHFAPAIQERSAGRGYATSAVMFVFKKISALEMFEHGAAARPWLRALLIATSIAGTGALTLLNGEAPNVNSISYLLELAIGTAANSFLAHVFYAWLKPTT